MSRYREPANPDCPPVLLIIFNRPVLAARVLEQIRIARPAQLFVAADGPREEHESDARLCEETRDAVLDRIDWLCEVRTLFQHTNLGGGLGPLAAINWFFENVTEGIILEDDCLPSLSFFPFCNQVLHLYRDDTRVMAISGTNVLHEWRPSSNTYFFSYFGGNWGWASWRRAWKQNDHDMNCWKHAESRQVVEHILGDRCQAFGVSKWFDSVVGQESRFWDFQWFLSRLINSGLSVVPARNMVSNIGFGVEATHTKRPSKISGLPLYETATPVPVNLSVVADREYDKAVADAYGFYEMCAHGSSSPSGSLNPVTRLLRLPRIVREGARRFLRRLYWFAFPESKQELRVADNNCVIGPGSKIYSQAQIMNDSTNKANITIGTNSHIGGRLIVWANAGHIDVGDSTYIGEDTRIFSAQHVRIGHRVQIAHGCNIFDCNVHSLDAEERHKEYLQNIQSGQIRMHDLRESEVIIEDDAWLGACVIVMKGVRIGEGAIIGAGSVVTRDIPRYTVAVGNPAKVIKSLKT